MLIVTVGRQLSFTKNYLKFSYKVNINFFLLKQGWFWGFEETRADKFKCVSVQGESKILVEPLCGKNTTAKSVFLDRAEKVLHDVFGGVNYWRSRRSMIFSKSLRLFDYISLKYFFICWKKFKNLFSYLFYQTNSC